MATDSLSNGISEVLSGLTAGVAETWREARAERIRRATPIVYWCRLFDDFALSPQEFYALVIEHLKRRAVPDLVNEVVMMREGAVFSRQRLYLELRRERFVFQICAAVFGTSWFVSSRLFDKRRDARWFDILVVLLSLWMFSCGFWLAAGPLIAIAVLGTVVTFFWSLMRLGASADAAPLDDLLSRVPCVGRLYESLFHPDTFFRQDQRSMYKEAVNRALTAALADLQTQKGLKPPSAAPGRLMPAELQ